MEKPSMYQELQLSRLVRRNAPINTGITAPTQIAAVAIEIRSGPSRPLRAMPSSSNAHEMTKLAAPSKKAPNARQPSWALANRNAAIRYQIAANNAGIE